jgi:hypothetical protein
VSAFARNDHHACLSADAGFVFYTLEQPLLSCNANPALYDR